MSHGAPIDIDSTSPPFDRYGTIRRLAPARSGHASWQHARHQLYVARDKRTRADVLIKVTSKPGLVYEQDLANEIASLSTINRELPDSRYFPLLGEHGRLRDDRIYLVMSLFHEWPLATIVGSERMQARQPAHLRTAIEVARALAELHGLEIWHVDLNPMNILARLERGKPVIRIVDFESSYETARHGHGASYNPPTTTAFSAPEISGRAPDARSDVFSSGAVLYTMLAGYEWTWRADVWTCVEDDTELAPELRDILLKAVRPDPDRRYRSVVEWQAALDEYLGRELRIRPPG
jgi:serine/threonine protein kinase